MNGHYPKPGGLAAALAVLIAVVLAACSPKGAAGGDAACGLSDDDFRTEGILQAIPVRATFLDEVSWDIPHQNWGVREWDADFRAMKNMGINTVVLIRAGLGRWIAAPFECLLESEEVYYPPVDLVEMFLTLADKYDMAFYFGMYDSGKYWQEGLFQREIDLNLKLIDEVWARYGHHESFQGWYLSQEISRRTKNMSRIYAEVGRHAKAVSGGLKTMISPYIYGVKTDQVMAGDKALSVEEHRREWNEILGNVAGAVDILAFQDGQVDYRELYDYLVVNKALADKYGMECWTNIESFDRDMPIRFLPIKWEKLLLKLDAARRDIFTIATAIILKSTTLTGNGECSMKQRADISYMLFLAVTAAVGGLLFGYDTAVISGTVELVTARFGLDSLQQGWYVGCALAGSIAGVLCAGVLSDRLGRRRTMLVSAVLFTVSAAGCALCADFTQLVVYRIVGGLGIGVVSVVSPLYISEVSAARRRGMLVSFYQLAVTMGFLAAYTVNYLLLRMGQTAGFETAWMQRIFVDEVWRGMLGAETLPALVFFVIIFFIPESPRWLALRGHTDRALRVLGRINGDRAEAAAELAAIETAVGGGQAPQWRLLLSKGIRTAVLVGAAIAILGQFMGVNAVLYYGPSIFERAGWSGSDSLFAQILVGAVNMLTTVLALAIIDRVGRKKLVYWGVSGMVLSLLLIGTCFLTGERSGMPDGVLLAAFLCYIFCCAISVCAVVWVLLSEMYPIRVRGAAMSIAGFALWVGTYLVGQLTPWMLANLTPAGTFFLFAAMCVPYMLLIWKAVPETSGRTLEEIERYWTR